MAATTVPQLVDALEMARLLGIPRDSLYELAIDGKLQGAYRLGNRWRFDPDEVLAGARVGASSGNVVDLTRSRA